IGAALRDHFEIQCTARTLGRDADAYFLAVDLRLAEELVLVGDALRKLGLAERGALRLEAEALAVQLVAVRDCEAHFDGITRGLRGEAERLLRLEKILGVCRSQDE